MRMVPSVTSYSRATNFAIVLFPAPLAPARATFCPGATENLRPLSTRGPPAYPNDTSSMCSCALMVEVKRIGLPTSTIFGVISRTSRILRRLALRRISWEYMLTAA